MKQGNVSFVAQAGVIAAVYAVASLITMFFLQGLAWGPIQFRISEALCVLALFTPAAIPGLTIGCIIANLYALILNGTGALGLFDVGFGSLATFLGAWLCWKFRSRPRIALCFPVVSNALIVPAYLPFLLKGLGFYSIPFTSIQLDAWYGLMYLFGVVAVGIGEAAVLFLLGWPLYQLLKKADIDQVFKSEQQF